MGPRVFELFAGVDHILHAGDIGPPGVVLQLEKIGPVTAVRSNCDLEVGHTHRPCIERWGDVLLFNPGYGGKQRFHLPRSVGILRCDGSGVSAAYLAL